jgi:hypothetical protein
MIKLLMQLLQMFSGPGDSETSAWDDSDDVVLQWNEHEHEKLTSIGELKFFSLSANLMPVT